MNESLFIRGARRVYHKFFGNYRERKVKKDYFGIPILDEELGNQQIYQLLNSGKPALICRFGSTEMFTISNYFEINKFQNSTLIEKVIRKIKGESDIWRPVVKHEMEFISGFFPPTDENLKKFVELYLEITPDIDILGVWHNYYEDVVVKNYCPKAKLVPLRSIEPYYFEEPWSVVLKNKKVLLIHPFKDSIEKQFLNKDKLFENKNVLPDFELITIKAIQSNANGSTHYESWFDAMDYLMNEISKTNFDIAIIGAGTYGLPLAAYVKSIGKQAIHMGGATQIMFGIKGTRWDNMPGINKFYNEFWTRPQEHETPKGYKKVEGGSYW